MGPQEEKIFIVSLDGATFDVIDPLVAQGYMPNVGQLMSHSVAAELESVVPPVTAPAWTSFMTGKQPSKHGIFDFARFNESDYSWSINNAQHIRSKTLWQILSEKGKRVIVLNLPYTYPSYEVNGVLVSGWDAPFTDAAFSSPASVGDDILRMFPDYKSNLWVSEFHPLDSDKEFEEFTRRLKVGFEQQAKFALHLLKTESWDVFMVHFQQTDWIQHKLWNYIEQGCKDAGDHTPKVEATRNCYRRFDELFGLLLRQVEPLMPTTILLSDHGFGRLMGAIHPNSYLQKWGYLALKPEAEDSLKGVKNIFRQSRYKPFREVYSALAKSKNAVRKGNAKQSHQSWADNAGDVMSSRGASWDWSRTKAAAIYSYLVGFVYVNCIGRGPKGIVKPGSEYETIVADLIARFRELRHPHSGERLLQDVVRCADLYPATADGVLLPDLALIPAGGCGFSFSLSDAAPVVSKEGTHRHNGVLVIGGNSVKHPVTDFRPHLIDLAPTVLHLLGLPVPGDMDGMVLEDILLRPSEVRFEDADNSAIGLIEEYSQQEAEIIAQRLKGLGYLS